MSSSSLAPCGRVSCSVCEEAPADAAAGSKPVVAVLVDKKDFRRAIKLAPGTAVFLVGGIDFLFNRKTGEDEDFVYAEFREAP